jgi:YHS domain-containing protein
MKTVILFLATFALGAAAALVVRTARHEPHAEHAAASDHGALSSLQSPASLSSHHAPAAPAPARTATPVNTLCAICGMDVDPALPTAEYQGKTIGFGCRMCPPKFKADPEKYGPAYLRNEVLKN